MRLYWFLPNRVTCRCRFSTLVLPASFRRPPGRIVTLIYRSSFGRPDAPVERRVSRGRSVEPGFRQRWPGQCEEQPAEVVDRTVRAPSMHGAKNVLAPALDRPIGAVETVCLAVRLKRPEVRGDQRVLQGRPISNGQACIAALSTGEMRRTIDA